MRMWKSYCHGISFLTVNIYGMHQLDISGLFRYIYIYMFLQTYHNICSMYIHIFICVNDLQPLHVHDSGNPGW